MGKAHAVAAWVRSIGALLERCARRRWHGTIRIVVFGGDIRQVVVEASYVEPGDLESDAVEALAQDAAVRID